MFFIWARLQKFRRLISQGNCAAVNGRMIRDQEPPAASCENATVGRAAISPVFEAKGACKLPVTSRNRWPAPAEFAKVAQTYPGGAVAADQQGKHFG
jgi:hypothetical protein